GTDLLRVPAVVKALAPGVAQPVLHQVAGTGRRAHPVAAVGLDLDRLAGARLRDFEVEGVDVVTSDPRAPDPVVSLAAHPVDQRVRVDAAAPGRQHRLERELALLGTRIEPAAAGLALEPRPLLPLEIALRVHRGGGRPGSEAGLRAAGLVLPGAELAAAHLVLAERTVGGAIAQLGEADAGAIVAAGFGAGGVVGAAAAVAGDLSVRAARAPGTALVAGVRAAIAVLPARLVTSAAERR